MADSDFLERKKCRILPESGCYGWRLLWGLTSIPQGFALLYHKVLRPGVRERSTSAGSGYTGHFYFEPNLKYHNGIENDEVQEKSVSR